MTSRESVRYVLIGTLLGTFCGCSMVNSPSTSPDRPYLVANASDSKALDALAQKQDRLLKACTKPTACTHLLYARGLTALFESRARASTIFQHIVEIIPGEPIAIVSAQWLAVLQQDDRASDPRQALLAQYVTRELLDRDASFTQARTKLMDKRIEDLSRQLDMLKQIEQQRPVPDSPSSNPPLTVPSKIK